VSVFRGSFPDLESTFRTTIRDKIIPHAVSWFTGEACTAEDFLDIDDDGEEDEDEDDGEDEEEEEEESKPVKKVDLLYCSNIFPYVIRSASPC
jgi:nucleosome assembly protein 1-like 1